jgi:hypothetical protein
VRVAVLLDGQPLNREERGGDVRIDSDGRSWVTIGEGRLYSLVHARQGGYGTHTLTLVVEGKGLEAYTFTFG